MSSLPALTVFDIETTGLDPKKGNRIIEIAGIRIEDGQINMERTFEAFVNPEMPIPPEATRIHKITDTDVATAATIMNVLPEFLTFAQGSLLFAHNANFDMGFLEVEKDLCWGYIELPECFCSMKLSQALYPNEFRHNLDVISTRFGLEINGQRHRALADVELTAKAILHMFNHGAISSIDQLRKKAAIRKFVVA